MTDLPTTRADWSGLGREVRRTLGDPGLLAVALFVGLAVALSASVSRRLQFGLETLASDDLPTGFKIEFLLLHLPGLGPVTRPIEAILIVAVAAIAGLTAATLARAVLAGSESANDPADRDAGIALGGVGITSAALGPAVLAGVAGLAGADGVLSGLPFGGLEGSLLAVPALVLATCWLADGLDDGEDGSGSRGPGER